MEQQGQPHEHLQGLLRTATGRSCEIVAVFIDIRGFSSFAEQNDSPAVAKYLRSFASATLEKYFRDPSFFKLTGDGLLVVYEHADTEVALREALNLALRQSILLVQDFDHIADDDVMVNIAGRLPNSLGAGIARGPATCITSGQVVLDYAGRCLNLAARAMDKARPLGVVFADRHADRLVDPELDPLLGHDGICIRGISEQEPLPIRVTREVAIKEADRHPTELDDAWGDSLRMTLQEVRETSNFAFELPRGPRPGESAWVYVSYPALDTSGEPTGNNSYFNVRGKVDRHPESWVVVVSFDQIRTKTRDLPLKVTGFLGFKASLKIDFTPYWKAGRKR